MKFISKNETMKNLEESRNLYPMMDKNLDLNTQEEEILLFWKENQIFEKRVEMNSQSLNRFSFMDGPITANNPMGIHHVWGRSLKDLMQRYWAMKGYKQRFQNGFDCQGLWIEVEVEKALGLNSKRAIENFGLMEFSNKCKERLEKYSKLITEQSLRLGQWMHWDNSYYTHTDTNISYIWHFLKKCHENGWLIKGQHPMPWCPRCGTSLSQHEQHDSYKELTHLALYVKFPLLGVNNQQLNEFLLVWTTTPWTLTANTNVAVHPNKKYCKVQVNSEIYYLMKARLNVLKEKFVVLDEFLGKQLEKNKYLTPFNNLTNQKSVLHNVVLWTDVGENEGTGIVHIAPGCGLEDFQLSEKYNLSKLTPIDEFGVFIKEYDDFYGLPVNEANKKVLDDLKRKNLLFYSENYTHRYPTCWRCNEELVFRLVEEWFIECEKIKPLLKRATKEVEWLPKFTEKRMLDWLKNMGNWCISRKRYWGLPLPFYECAKCGKLIVIGSKEELIHLAVKGLDQLKELHRPWIDNVKIKCPDCNSSVSRIKEVGDCWLDAGIVPFSTMKYLEGKNYWNQWFPIDCVCEMREQIRLWFYSQLFMSVTLIGKAPYKRVIAHEKVHDKDGRAMHRSWGNAIWFEDALNAFGADYLRWIFIKQPLSQLMKFGYHLKEEIQPFFNTIWNIYTFFTTFANLDQFIPSKEIFNDNLLIKKYSLLDQWLISKLNTLVNLTRKNLDKAEFRKVALEIEKFVDELSTWYIRRNRRRFWKTENTYDKNCAYSCLYITLLTLCKLLAPLIPFTSEELYQNLTKKALDYKPLSVHLSDYPQPYSKLINRKLNEKMDVILEIIKLGRSARNKGNLRIRQPLTKIYVWNKDISKIKIIKEFELDILAELNVKQIEIVDNPSNLFELQLKPNFAQLGPKLKNQLQDLQMKLVSLKQAEIMQAFLSNDQILEIYLGTKSLKLKINRDLFIEVKPSKIMSVALGTNFAVILDTTLSKELTNEGLVRDLIRHIQKMRKDLELLVDEKIAIFYNGDSIFQNLINDFIEYIESETLAVRIENKINTAGKEIILQGNKIIIDIQKI